MPAGYKKPSLDGMVQLLVALFKALLPDRNIGSRFTPAWKFVKTIAGASTDLHAHIDAAERDVMPDSARFAALDRFLKIFAPGGLDKRKGATPARKAAAGRVTGTVGKPITLGMQLVHRASGLLFQINQSTTVPGAGFIDVDIVAIDKGSQTRLEKGEVLEFVQQQDGLDTQVPLQKALDEDGFDAELDGAARNRLLAALAKPSAGGTQADFVAWALAQLGIAAAFCYPTRAGLGTVDVAAMHAGTGTARKLTDVERAVLLAAIQALAPAQLGGPFGALRVLKTIEETANVEITIAPNGEAAYAFDWDDSAGALVVNAWTAATRLLQFTTNRPGTMAAGHRIVLKGVASLQDGKPYTIEALSGNDAVILEEAPTVAPAATDLVYAGGPLTALIRDAILAHINGELLYAGEKYAIPASIAGDAVDLEPLLDGIGTANPAGLYGAWRGSLLKGALSTIAMYTRGVRNHAITTPAVDQDATDYAFPNDDQIGFLNPGYVLVRRG